MSSPSGPSSGPRAPSPRRHLAAATGAPSSATTVRLGLQQGHEGRLGAERAGRDEQDPRSPWGVQTSALLCYVSATLSVEEGSFGPKDVNPPLLYQVEECPSNIRRHLEPLNVAVCGNQIFMVVLS